MKNLIVALTMSLICFFNILSCEKKKSDEDLLLDAQKVTAKNPTISVEVKEGMAHLSGTFASDTEKNKTIISLKAIPGLKDVMDMASVASSETVESLKKIKKVVKEFPSVKVDLVNSEIVVSGNVSSVQEMKIKASIDALKIGKYTNNLVIK